MLKLSLVRLPLLLTCALAFASCSVSQTDTPDLTGPSEFALSFKVAATPDSISQDGGSQSSITISAFDPNGKPKTAVPFRLDMAIEGQAVDYGTLSTKTVVTGSDGRANVTYTSPPAVPVGTNLPSCTPSVFSNTLPGGCVQIIATPVGGGFATATTQSVEIHLVPLGVILPPAATPTAQFTFNPSSPSANSPVQFDASASCGGQVDTGGACSSSGGSIASYTWDFGDGTSGSGRTASHAFTNSQTYSVTLTVTNDRGRAASVTKPVSVGAGSAPSAAFVFSPTPAQVGQEIFFDASNSRPGLGHTIARYNWTWGDGESAPSSGSPLQDHDYQSAGTFTVTLTVTDEAGQIGTTTQSVSVGAGTTPGVPSVNFVSSPSAPVTGQQVNFDASGSTAASGHHLTQYKWNFGDGSALLTSASPLATHSFATAGTFSVTLTVTDDTGQTASKPQTVTIGGSSAPSAPEAKFVSSPSAPNVSQQVNFDASQSSASPGRSITQYQWNFGDGTALVTSGSPLAFHSYTAVGTYTVVLTVTDSDGATGLTNQNVTISAGPTAVFVFSPTDPGPAQVIQFNASQSTPAPGHTIVSYSWNWGDGTLNAPGVTASHAFTTENTYTVVLTVTDDAGKTGITTRTITVKAPAGP